MEEDKAAIKREYDMRLKVQVENEQLVWKVEEMAKY